MEKSGHKTISPTEDPKEMNDDEPTIILDGKATEKVPIEPSLMERTKEVMENIGTAINSI